MKTTDEIMELVEAFVLADNEYEVKEQHDVLKIAIEELAKDAAKYQWLCVNVEKWSWQPSKYNAEVISGLCAKGTVYLGYSFSEAVDAAMGEKTE